MSRELKNVAVILAGGIGERMRASMPKQLLKIAGKSIIDHTLSVFQTNDQIDEVIVLMTPGYLDKLKIITDKYDKISIVMDGGATRNETSKKAIEYLSGQYDECNILFHDAVRPFLSDRIIGDCIEALKKYRAVDVAIPSSDTIIEVSGDEIVDIPDRSKLRRGQTPQAFKLSTIRQAYELADKDPNFKATDDCSVVLKYLPKEKIYVVEGSENNMKVTQPVDAFIADKLFQISSRDNLELDEASRKRWLQGKTMVVFGGSKGIGLEIAKLGEEYQCNVFSFSRTLNYTNVTREDDIKRALAEAQAKTGRIDFVIDTAGELTISPLCKLSVEQIEDSIKVNYLAPVLVAKNSFEYLKQTGGEVVLFTSSSYTRGRSDYSLYSSSKAATVNLVQALAEEWIVDNVRINCINPERTATLMRTNAFGNEDKNTLLDPKVVAKATIDTLVSSLTGQVIDVRRS